MSPFLSVRDVYLLDISALGEHSLTPRQSAGIPSRTPEHVGALGVVDRVRGEMESLFAGIGHIENGIEWPPELPACLLTIGDDVMRSFDLGMQHRAGKATPGCGV